MIIVIYLDLYFFLNLFMDFVLLLLAARFLKINFKMWRILLGSLVGATGACAILVLQQLPVLFRYAIAYIALTMLMVIISYGRCRGKRLLGILATLYCISVFLGGILEFLWRNSSLSEFVYEQSGARSNRSISIFAVLITVLPLLFLLPYAFRYFNEFRRRSKTVFQVILSLEGKAVEVKGLFDTGNHLREPISNKPVIIVEQKVIEEIMTKDLLDYTTKIKLVPYRSIGKDSGTLYGIVLDEIVVHINDEQHTYKEVIACLYKGVLSSKEDYQVILHEELI